MNRDNTTRRKFLAAGGVAFSGLAASQWVEAADPDGTLRDDDAFPRLHPGRGGPVGSDTDRGKVVPGRRSIDDPPVPVETPDIHDLPWKIVNGVKEYHLVAQHVKREFLPGQFFDVWGYNGSVPGPTIQANQGDRVRIVVHNELPEPTTVHWHGLELPIRFDGVPGVTQDPIMPGKEFVYEFDLHQDGTFLYHSHGAMQEIMGMGGAFIIHPARTYDPPVDRDFVIFLQEFPILPMSTVPNSVSEEFNFFTINGRSGPYTTPMVVRLGDRVRIRFINLSAMDHHPMHLHGHTFWITGTEAGRIPPSAWIPSNNVLVGVAQNRDVEFIANNPGDWMLHCHILHHMMNHMVSMVGMMQHHMSDQRRPGEFGIASGRPHGENAMSKEMVSKFGAGLGHTIRAERAAMTGPHLQHAQKQREADQKYNVPGFPQDMMGMPTPLSKEQQQQVNKRAALGMRQNWFTGVEGMMTVLRVLPDELYDRVLAGDKEVEPGASVPGGGRGTDPNQGGHKMNGKGEAAPQEHHKH